MRTMHRLILSLLLAFAGVETSFAQSTGAAPRRLAVLAVSQQSLEVTRAITLPALQKLGFTVGVNLEVVFEAGPEERMPAMVQRLLATRPDALLVIGSDALLAARAATTTVPTVSFGPDPIPLGLAPSLARPSGNVTGIAILSGELNAKRIDLLRELRPGMRRVGALLQRNSAAPIYATEMRAFADKAGIAVVDVLVDRPEEYPVAFSSLRAAGAEALVIGSSPILFQNAGTLSRMATEAGLPAICEWPEMARFGCLLGYGPELDQERARLATFLARVLRGVQPRDIPFEEPTDLSLAVNLATARALKLTIPASILARAEELID